MHPRRLDRAHHLDRPGELAFERPEARDVLHERGQAERTELVEQFVANGAATRKALFRQDHPRRGRLSGRSQDDSALGVDVKRHARFAQRGADGGDIVSVESRIEGLHGRPAQVPAGQARHREGGYAYNGQGGQTPDAQSLQVRPKPFDLRQQVRRHVRARVMNSHRPSSAAELAPALRVSTLRVAARSGRVNIRPINRPLAVAPLVSASPAEAAQPSRGAPGSTRRLGSRS